MSKKGARWTPEQYRQLIERGKIERAPPSALPPADKKQRVPKTKKPAPVYGDRPLQISHHIKPMSVNGAWKGKRYKTDEYKQYEKLLLTELPTGLPPAPPYRIDFEFGFSNMASDWDNPVKPLQDIMQQKYGFNDKQIMEAHVLKKIVPAGSEYFIVHLTTMSNV